MATNASDGAGSDGGRSRRWTPVRDHLALIVFLFSALGITLPALLLMWRGGDTERGQVFTTVLPVFSTWVGTILAFYFTRENFEATTNSLRNVVARLTPEQRLQQTPVKAASTARSAMRGIELGAGKQEPDVTVQELCAMVSQGATRLPVFAPGGAIRYLIHASMLFKFLSDLALRGTSAAGSAVVDPAGLTLQQFLQHRNDDGTLMQEVVMRIAFVASGASLAAAREAMLAVKGAQDVIVTATGKPDEPVEGWLTNADLARYAAIE